MTTSFKCNWWNLMQSPSCTSEDPRSFPATMRYFAKGSQCDTLLVLKDGSIPVHGVILSAASPFFKMILDVQVPYFPGLREVIMPDYSVCIMRKVVVMVYSMQVYCDNPQELREVQETIKQLQIYNYKNLSEKRILAQESTSGIKTSNSNTVRSSVKNICAPLSTTSSSNPHSSNTTGASSATPLQTPAPPILPSPFLSTSRQPMMFKEKLSSRPTRTPDPVKIARAVEQLMSNKDQRLDAGDAPSSNSDLTILHSVSKSSGKFLNVQKIEAVNCQRDSTSANPVTQNSGNVTCVQPVVSTSLEATQQSIRNSGASVSQKQDSNSAYKTTALNTSTQPVILTTNSTRTDTPSYSGPNTKSITVIQPSPEYKISKSSKDTNDLQNGSSTSSKSSKTKSTSINSPNLSFSSKPVVLAREEETVKKVAAAWAMKTRSETSSMPSNQYEIQDNSNSVKHNSLRDSEPPIKKSTPSVVEAPERPPTSKVTRRSITMGASTKDSAPEQGPKTGSKKLDTVKNGPDTHSSTAKPEKSGNSNSDKLSANTSGKETRDKQSLSSHRSSSRKEAPDLASSSLDLNRNASEKRSEDGPSSSVLKSNSTAIFDTQLPAKNSNTVAGTEMGTVGSTSSKVSLKLTNLETVRNSLHNCQFCFTPYPNICDANQCLKFHGMKRCYICFHAFPRDVLFQHFKLSHSQGKENGEVECPFCEDFVTFQTATTHFEKMHLRKKPQTSSNTKQKKEKLSSSLASPPYLSVPPLNQIHSELFDSSPIKSPMKKRLKLASSEQIMIQNFELGTLFCSVSRLRKDNQTLVYIRENS